MEMQIPAPQPAHNAQMENRMKNCTTLSESDHASHPASSRAPLLSPWLSRSRCRSRPTLTKSHRHPCPTTFRCQTGTRRSSWVTPSAPRTTSACPQALASPTHSSRRRPPCSTTTASKSSPTSSAPTRSSRTLIRRWWPMARFAPRGRTRGHEHGLGQGAQSATKGTDPISSRPGCHCLAPARRWLEPKTDPPVATS